MSDRAPSLHVPASLSADDAGAESPAVRPPRVLSADQIADDLGLHRAEVVDLMRRGDLPAKRIGSQLFTTSDKLAAFVARADPRSALPRFRDDDPVVVLEDEGELVAGRFAGEAADGRVLVRIKGFLVDHTTAYAPEQVQPLTARIPAQRTN